MRIFIVEDNEEERLHLGEYTRLFCENKGLTVSLTCYPDGDSFLRSYPSDNRPDLVFMDIEMPGLSGMETARQLRRVDQKVQLVFVTFMVQYAIEGYSVDAADFLAKPISYASFCAHMDRIMVRLRINAPRFLETSYAKRSLTVQIQQISYIESLQKKTIIHLTDGTQQFSTEPLYALEEKLQELERDAFFRCHNAYLVNLSHVQSIASANAMVDGDSLPISKYRKKEFMQKLAAYRGELF